MIIVCRRSSNCKCRPSASESGNDMHILKRINKAYNNNDDDDNDYDNDDDRRIVSQ